MAIQSTGSTVEVDYNGQNTKFLLLSNELTFLREVVRSVQPRRTRQAKAHRVPTAITTDEMGYSLAMQSAADESTKWHTTAETTV